MKKTILIGMLIMLICRAASAQQPLKINPIFVDNSFDAVSCEKLEMAVEMLTTVLNSQEFKDAVKKLDLKTGNLGLNNDQILALISGGNNWYQGANPDYLMDIRLRLTNNYEGSGNFGTTNMNRDSLITRTHRCFVLQNDVRCYAAHLAHEYMHQIGFLDERTWWLGPKTHSVPYRIGNLINKLLGNETACVAVNSTCQKE